MNGVKLIIDINHFAHLGNKIPSAKAHAENAKGNHVLSGYLREPSFTMDIDF